jgi:hypothetical protein
MGAGRDPASSNDFSPFIARFGQAEKAVPAPISVEPAKEPFHNKFEGSPLEEQDGAVALN